MEHKSEVREAKLKSGMKQLTTKDRKSTQTSTDNSVGFSSTDLSGMFLLEHTADNTQAGEALVYILRHEQMERAIKY